VDVQVKL